MMTGPTPNFCWIWFPYVFLIIQSPSIHFSYNTVSLLLSFGVHTYVPSFLSFTSCLQLLLFLFSLIFLLFHTHTFPLTFQLIVMLVILHIGHLLFKITYSYISTPPLYLKTSGLILLYLISPLSSFYDSNSSLGPAHLTKFLWGSATLHLCFTASRVQP